MLNLSTFQLDGKLLITLLQYYHKFITLILCITLTTVNPVYSNQPLKYEIQQILKQYDLPDDHDFLYHIAMVESYGGKYLKQFNGGPALGYFQIEPWVCFDIIKHTKRYHYIIDFIDKYADKALILTLMEEDLRFQVILARLHLTRFKQEIPKDIYSQALLWKKIWNTNLGKGTVKHFITVNTKMGN